jgi:hypothetical protein
MLLIVTTAFYFFFATQKPKKVKEKKEFRMEEIDVNIDIFCESSTTTSPFKQGYEDAKKAALDFNGGENAIDKQSLLIWHLRELLRELPATKKMSYVQGWQALIEDEEQVLREYLKYPFIS